MSSPVAPLHARRRDGGDAMRTALLAAAARILATEGRQGLTARRLGAAAGATTRVIYSHFGGMSGIVAALYAQGFALLADQLARAVEQAPPDQQLAAIARAYRAFARSNGDLFDLMYGPSVRALLPTPATRTSATAALAVLAGVFANQGHADVQDRARSYWAAMHGIVALAHTGWFTDDETDRRLGDLAAASQ